MNFMTIRYLPNESCKDSRSVKKQCLKESTTPYGVEAKGRINLFIPTFNP